MPMHERGRPPMLPGPCVPIPDRRVALADDAGRRSGAIATHTVSGLDLDGAGSPVVLVPPARRRIAANAVFWHLFIARGDCGHELGVVAGLADPEPEAGWSHGLRDFSVVEPLPDELLEEALAGVGVTVYSFDGDRYVGGATDVR